MGNAHRVGMSRDGLYKALSAEGNPTWSTVLKVTNALGILRWCRSTSVQLIHGRKSSCTRTLLSSTDPSAPDQ